MRRHLFLVSTSVLLLFVPDMAAAPTKSIDVDCSKGKTITAALQDDASPLTIRFQGTCAESVLIERDNVTLLGLGEAAIDGATLPEPKPDGVTVRGATNVMLAGFAVRGMRYGVSAFDGASLSLDQMTLEANEVGLWAKNGVSLRLNDLTARVNARDGIGLWTHCSADLSGTVVASGNARTGIIVDSSALSAQPDTVVQADNNQTGLHFQGANALLGAAGVSVLTRRNSCGVSGFRASLWVPGLESLDNRIGVSITEHSTVTSSGTVSGSTGTAIYASRSSQVDLNRFTVSNNPGLGILASGSSLVTLLDSAVRSNKTGVELDDSSIDMNGTVIVSNVRMDVGLYFGSRGTFESGNTVGRVVCEETVLVRGDVACPGFPASANSEPSRNGRSATDERLPREPLAP